MHYCLVHGLRIRRWVGVFAPGFEVLILLNFCFVGMKILGSVGSVAGGLIVGKEGPLVHVGACIASLIGQGGSVRYGMTWKWLRYLKNDRDRRDLVTCGAAAGVAAAFRAPVGGVLFALEEVTSWYDDLAPFAATICSVDALWCPVQHEQLRTLKQISEELGRICTTIHRGWMVQNSAPNL